MIFYTSVKKGLKLKVGWALIATVVQVAGKRLVERAFSLQPPSPPPS